MRIVIIALISILFININSKGQTNSINFPLTSLETIEKIHIGQSKNAFSNELKRLGIKRENFSSNWLMNKNLPNGKIESYLINFHYTELFNFEEFKILNNVTEHPALIHSESIDNINISSIILLLGHTGESINMSPKKTSKNRIKYFKQDLNKELFYKIFNLYINKYGNPIMIQDSTIEINYYRLYKDQILKEKESSYKNYKAKWETKYFNIEIFPGFNYNAYYIPGKTYSTSSHWVSSNLSDQPLQPNEQMCFTFPYIKYSLNELGLRLFTIGKLDL
ncbi:hypothetical protein [Aquirufa sp.]|jgi:hypothetical protein|uniref:hypothetical protein n=1 Tax=Aquirufa sp. TaxID=2676249 RepID=UPI0037C0DE8B